MKEGNAHVRLYGTTEIKRAVETYNRQVLLLMLLLLRRAAGMSTLLVVDLVAALALSLTAATSRCSTSISASATVRTTTVGAARMATRIALERPVLLVLVSLSLLVGRLGLNIGLLLRLMLHRCDSLDVAAGLRGIACDRKVPGRSIPGGRISILL